MNIKVFFKYYIYLIIIVGSAVGTYSWATDSRSITTNGLLFLIVSVILIWWEDIMPNNMTISLAGSNNFLLLSMVSIRVCIVSVALYSAVEVIMQYKRFRKHGIRQAIENILFNTGVLTLSVCITWLLLGLLKVDFNSPIDYWKVLMLAVIDISVNILILQIAMIFHSGQFKFYFEKLFSHLFYDVVLSMLLVYAYYDRGLFGVLFAYILFIPIQRLTNMYVKLKDQEDELFMDPLTKVYNYKYLTTVLSDRIAKKVPFTLVILDLNKFKDINDTHGHNIGNMVLRQFAEQLRKKVACSNILCRFGGDEFCIITDGTPETDKSLKIYFESQNSYSLKIDGNEIHYSSSYGFSHYNGTEDIDWNSILDSADKEMYLHKDICKN